MTKDEVRIVLVDVMREIGKDRPEALDSARLFHLLFRDSLSRRGWKVLVEFPVTVPLSSKKRRIDIVASIGEFTMAIELDRVNPRYWSLWKLRHLPFFKACILRTGEHLDGPLFDLDLVLGMNSL